MRIGEACDEGVEEESREKEILMKIWGVEEEGDIDKYLGSRGRRRYR